jgi:hypothetical protein
VDLAAVIDHLALCPRQLTWTKYQSRSHLCIRQWGKGMRNTMPATLGAKVNTQWGLKSTVAAVTAGTSLRVWQTMPRSSGRIITLQWNKGSTDGLRVGTVGAPTTFEKTAPKNWTKTTTSAECEMTRCWRNDREPTRGDDQPPWSNRSQRAGTNNAQKTSRSQKKREEAGGSIPTPALPFNITMRIDNSLLPQGWTGDKPCLITTDTGASMTIARPDVAKEWPKRTPSSCYMWWPANMWYQHNAREWWWLNWRAPLERKMVW